MEPATDWKETIAPGEAAHLEELAEQLRDLQRRHAEGKQPMRALHAKGNCGVTAELRVLPDLPPHARVGLFAEPATYRAYVRFSNGAGRRQPDGRGDVRGIAVKVVGVDGPKIIPGLEQARTQDFLAIRTPATPFRDADEFVWLVRAAERPALLLPRALARFGPLRAIGLLRRLAQGLGAPMPSLATTRYFSALPIKFGPYAVHYALDPLARPDGDEGAKDRSPDRLGQELAARLAGGPVEYDFRVQFFVDEARTPIEDGSREWREADAPFVTLARLTLPQQQVDSPRGRRVSEWVETLSFDPWHTTADFRPLGNMMRARSHAYRLSTMERGAAGEPDGSERFE
jgi:hypothetical protein